MIRFMPPRIRETTFSSAIRLSTGGLAALALAVGLFPTPAAAQMTCELSSSTARPGTTVALDLFLEDVSDVRGYQATTEITRTSGTGQVTVVCPDGVAVDEARADYIFFGLDTVNVTPDCPNCGVILSDCEGRRVAAFQTSRFIGSVS